LRKKGDKQAILYEVVAKDTTEEYTSKKRSDVRQFQDAKKGDNRKMFG